MIIDSNSTNKKDYYLSTDKYDVFLFSLFSLCVYKQSTKETDKLILIL